MAYRELELTLLSASDLKNVNLIMRMEVYAVVTISGDPLTRQCTAPDPYGGRHPCWNATLRFAVPPAAAAAAGGYIHVLLRAERVLGDRDVGEVILPLAELLASAAGPGPQPPQPASYQVRKVHRGEPRGVLNVTYRLGPVVAPLPLEPPPGGDNKLPVIAYPVPPQPPPHAAVRVAEREGAAAAPPKNGKSNGPGLVGPTQVCVGPHTQIILQGGPTRPAPAPTLSPTPSSMSPGKRDGARPKPPPVTRHQHSIRPAMADCAPKAGSFDMEAISQSPVPTSRSREPATSPCRPPASTLPSHSSSSSRYSSAYPSPAPQPQTPWLSASPTPARSNSGGTPPPPRAAASPPPPPYRPPSPVGVANHSGMVP